MSELGLGVMIQMLNGNKDSANAIQVSIGKTIKRVHLDENILEFEFEDGDKLNLWDDGQSCCESRYMTTSDKLDEFAGAQFLGIELKDGGGKEDSECDVHDMEFLDVKTSKGVFQMANHNEHNGYYGGFYVKAST